MDERSIVLTGFMGTGKTSVGRAVAQALGRRFVDMDAVLEERLGMSIGACFATAGEAAFRRAEAELVAELAGQADLVIATGGGALVPEANRRQALLPPDAELLANDRGTAPGLLARAGATWIACVPGVPHEMQAMVERLLPRLPALLPGLVVPALDEFCFAGLGESDAQERLGDLITERDPQVGITVNELGHITLRTRGTPAQVAERSAALRAALTPWLLPEPGIAPSLIAHCRARGLTIATAESCTAGHAAAQLAAIAGASDVLRAGFVTYQDAAKTAHLGVPAELLAEPGAVSEPVARAMAEGARRAAGTDLAVAITGVAGPGALGAIPAGTVHTAVADARGTVHRVVRIPGTRERVMRRAAAQALLLLWERVSGRAEAL